MLSILLTQRLQSVVQLSCPPVLMGLATTLLIAARTLGGTIGYAVALVIYENLASTRIGNYLAEAVIPLGLPPSSIGQFIGAYMSHDFAGLAQIPGVNGQIMGAGIDAIKRAQAKCYAIVWAAYTPATVIAIIACCCLKANKDKMNWITEAPLNEKEANIEAPPSSEITPELGTSDRTRAAEVLVDEENKAA